MIPICLFKRSPKMEKTDDPMYADHGGWMYVKYARASEMDAYMMVGGGSMEASMGCYGCHAKAANDSVFVSLSMDAGMNGADAAGMNGAGDGTNGTDGAGDRSDWRGMGDDDMADDGNGGAQ